MLLNKYAAVNTLQSSLGITSGRKLLLNTKHTPKKTPSDKINCTAIARNINVLGIPIIFMCCTAIAIASPKIPLPRAINNL